MKSLGSPSVRLIGLALSLVFGITLGCAGSDHLRRGDALLRAKKYDEAISAYEEALVESPDNADASRGINKARSSAVREKLRAAKKAFAEGDFPKALRLSLRARSMPLDLQEVDLTRQIDTQVAEASKRAEEEVARYEENGQFVRAVELSEQVAVASPKASTRSWADAVKKRAAEHYSSLAEQLVSQSLPGSAALQLAMAKRAGVQVKPERVMGLWESFTEPVCFAVPNIEVEDASGKASAAKEALVSAALSKVESLRERCGEGTRKLQVSIRLTDATIKDDTQTLTAAEPLPGSGFETTETYFEEIPYTAIEDVVEEEVRIEQRQRRDCAPRPGQPRGCREWTEEVEVKVPVTRQVEVQKVRKVERQRPKKGPFPEDKAVTYQQTRVQRAVALKGEVEVMGGAKKTFEVRRDTFDTARPALEHPMLKLAEDPMEATPMPELIAEAAAGVAKDVTATLAESVAKWSEDNRQEARKKALEGQLPQAEELYLRLLALGIEDDAQLEAFFEKRYGRSKDFVLERLLEAMGREVAKAETRGPAGARTQAKASFPKRLGATANTVNADLQAVDVNTNQRVDKDTTSMRTGSDGADKPAIDASELEALEAASLDEGGGEAQEGDAGTNAGDGSEPADNEAEEGGDGDKGADAPKDATAAPVKAQK